MKKTVQIFGAVLVAAGAYAPFLPAALDLGPAPLPVALAFLAAGLALLAERLTMIYTGQVLAIVSGVAGVFSGLPDVTLCFLAAAFALLPQPPGKHPAGLYPLAAIVGGSLVTLTATLAFASGHLGPRLHLWSPYTPMPTALAAACVVLGEGLLLSGIERNRRDITTEIGREALSSAAVVFLCTLGLWCAVVWRQSHGIYEQTRETATWIEAQLAQGIEDRVQSLTRMAKRLELNPEMEEEAWRSDAAMYVAQLGGVQAIGLAMTNYRYRWIEPVKENAAFLSADLSEEPNRKKAIDEARDYGRPTLTKTLTLRSGQQGFLVITPWYRDGDLGGYVIGVFRAGELIARLIKHPDYDISIADDEGPLFSLASPAGRPPGWVYEGELKLYHLGWRARISPTFTMLRRRDSTLPFVVLFAGSALSLLFGIIVHQSRTANAQREMILGVSRELVEAREKAVEASEMKSKFVANVSHELRTPINGMVGMAGLLEGTSLTEEQGGFVTMIRGSALSLLNIVNDLLDLSKIESGKLDFEEVDFDLVEMIKQTTSVHAIVAMKKGLAIDFNAVAGLPKWVKGDPTRLRQVLTNLIGNAVKFTPAGRITVRAEALPATAGNRLRFEVQDQGIGIPKDVIPTLFQDFHQANPSIARVYGGSGLGLSICRHFVERMGGRIGVISTEGSGSTFWFEVSLGKGNAVAAAPAAAKTAPGGTPALTGLRILVAEDDQVNRTIAQLVLRKLGAYADCAEDGNRALEAAQSGRYDAILMDVQMPGKDGFTVTKALREAGLKTPIVAMTANALKGDREQCLAVGMDDYVSKPVAADELTRVILAHVSPKAGAVVPPPAPAAPAKVAETLPTVDFAVIERLRSMGAPGEDIVPRILALYLDATRERIAKLTQALAEGRRNEIADIAHTLKSSTAQVGGMRLADISRQLERAARQTSDDLGPLVAAADQEAQRLFARLQELVPAGTPAAAA